MKVFVPIKERSQRTPNKNFRIFDGVPLYKHTLYKLTNFDVYVDTDSQKIIDEVQIDPKLKHVTAYVRDDVLVGDSVSVCKLINNFILKFNIIDEPICQLHVTSPFLDPRTLAAAFSKMKLHDSVVSCNALRTRLWRKEEYGMCPVNHNPAVLQQTQDLPAYYEENSLFYIFNSDVVNKSGNRIGSNPYFYETQFPENLDIDWESDWELANMVNK